ncbi:MAG: hypothetical protein FJX72_22230 [Armatimonadetes bacterium]|nr:hypothetical protein [Armatimonadota bacterium]
MNSWSKVRRSVRLAAMALLAVLCGSSWAGTISGTVAFKGKRPANVKAGYLGVTANGDKLHNHAGMTLGDFRGSVKSTTFGPRNAEVQWDPKVGLRFRHTELPPGRYLVWTRCDEHYMDWRIVNLSHDRPSATVALTFDRAAQGDVKLTVGRSARSYNVRISPLAPNGKPPLAGADVPMYAGWDADVKGASILLGGMRRGKYQVELRSQVKSGSDATGWSAILTDVGRWSVDVIFGKHREYRLR